MAGYERSFTARFTVVDLRIFEDGARLRWFGHSDSILEPPKIQASAEDPQDGF